MRDKNKSISLVFKNIKTENWPKNNILEQT